MSELDLLEAEPLALGGEAPGRGGTAWWKWALGAGAAAGLAYFLTKDLSLDALYPTLPRGKAPW